MVTLSEPVLPGRPVPRPCGHGRGRMDERASPPEAEPCRFVRKPNGGTGPHARPARITAPEARATADRGV